MALEEIAKSAMEGMAKTIENGPGKFEVSEMRDQIKRGIENSPGKFETSENETLLDVEGTNLNGSDLFDAEDIRSTYQEWTYESETLCTIDETFEGEKHPFNLGAPGTQDVVREPQTRLEPFDAKEIRDTQGDDSFEGVSRDTKDTPLSQDANDDAEPRSRMIENKRKGLETETKVGKELKDRYPTEQGYTVESERYLRDKDGNIVKDPETCEMRRVDFVVVKDGEVVDSVEVTSMTAPKAEQMAKEARIRDAGGNYIKDSNGNLVEIPKDVQTRVERR
jgi:hypothetical protein